MYPQSRIIPNNREPEYVIYFYESGLSEQYRQRQKGIFAGLNYGPPVGYDFSSDLTGRTTFTHPPTVEQIIANGYFAVPKGEAETAIISDKKATSWLGLDDVISQVRHRYEVYQGNIYELEVSKCAAINSFYTHEAWHGPSDGKVEYSMNKRLDRLYSEQREERINLWRDVSRLKLQLPENAQQYLASYRKASILENSEGDFP